MKYRIATAFGLLALGAAAIVPAGVGAQDISISIDGVVRGVEGEVVPLVDQAVAAEFVGDTCDGTVSTGNNASTHPNNDLLITTGGQTFTIPDVEAGANDVSVASGSIVLGENIVLELRLGPDAVGSGGLVLTFDCADTAVIPPTEPEPPTPEEPDFTG